MFSNLRTANNEITSYEKNKKINFITDIAKKINETVNINQVDLKIPRESIKNKFIDLLNSRMQEYSELEYTEEPSYKARIILGNHLMTHMGDLDNNWIRMYVIDQGSPKNIVIVKKTYKILGK